MRWKLKELRQELRRVGVKPPMTGQIVWARRSLIQPRHVILFQPEDSLDRRGRKRDGLAKLRWKGRIDDALSRLAAMPNSSILLGGEEDWRRFWREFCPDAAEERFGAEDESQRLRRGIERELTRLGVPAGYDGAVWVMLDRPGGAGTPWIATVSQENMAGQRARLAPHVGEALKWVGEARGCLSRLERLPDGAAVEQVWHTIGITRQALTSRR
jgi:hypothetical protein